MLIDVRTPAEYRAVHAVGARNVPLDQLDPKALSGRVYVICKSGARSRKACDQLRQAGVEAYCVEGGTDAWAASGLPVNRSQGAISLERQVRIAAGALVLLGIVLAWLVHPAMIAVSAFVGAGLMFAGVTDTCGMAMLLARMPWNRSRCASC